MSGSSREIGGFGSTSGGGTAGGTVDCSSINFKTNLSSPKAQVVSRISTGERLDIEVQTHNNNEVVVVVYKGELAGGLTSPYVQKLRECVNSGHSYCAEVVKVVGGQVTVNVVALHD